MPKIQVELDRKTFRRLTELAVKERRPVPWQAEILLLRLLTAPVEDGIAGRDTSEERGVGCAPE